MVFESVQEASKGSLTVIVEEFLLKTGELGTESQQAELAKKPNNPMAYLGFCRFHMVQGGLWIWNMAECRVAFLPLVSSVACLTHLLTLNIFLQKSSNVFSTVIGCGLLSKQSRDSEKWWWKYWKLFCLCWLQSFNPGSVLKVQNWLHITVWKALKILVLHARLIRSESLGVEPMCQ